MHAGIPYHLAGACVDGLRDRTAHTQVRAKYHKTWLSRVALDDNIVKETRRLHVYVECLHLEDDLDDAVDDGEHDVNEGNS